MPPKTQKTKVTMPEKSKCKADGKDTTGRSKQDELSAREVLFLLMKTDDMKKKNKRLQNEQETKYGLTIDAIKDMQKDLDHAKAANTSLLDELDLRKIKYNRLEADVTELRKKFEDFQTEVKALQRDQRKWRETETRLEETERKFQSLLKTNRALKTLLWKYSLNPGSVSVPNTPTRKQVADRNKYSSKSERPKQVIWK